MSARATIEMDRDAAGRPRRERRGVVCVVAAWIGAAAFGLGCASIDVETVTLRNDVDFASLRTFHIVSTEDADGRVYGAVEEAIARELTETGRARADAESADMWVVYRASALDRQKRRNAGDPDANSYRIVSYVEGTLAIDVFDRRAANRIWHGQAVIDERSRERLRDQADRVVEAILAELPDR